jgi:uncharacterized alkaline shock family protein YloU
MTDAQRIETDVGTITVPATVVADVVVRSAESVDGARVRQRRLPGARSAQGRWPASHPIPWRRGVEVDVDGDAAHVSLELAVRRGCVLPDVAREVQERVAESLRAICGLQPNAVDVAVEEIDA